MLILYLFLWYLLRANTNVFFSAQGTPLCCLNKASTERRNATERRNDLQRSLKSRWNPKRNKKWIWLGLGWFISYYYRCWRDSYKNIKISCCTSTTTATIGAGMRTEISVNHDLRSSDPSRPRSTWYTTRTRQGLGRLDTLLVQQRLRCGEFLPTVFRQRAIRTVPSTDLTSLGMTAIRSIISIDNFRHQ